MTNFHSVLDAFSQAVDEQSASILTHYVGLDRRNAPANPFVSHFVFFSSFVIRHGCKCSTSLDSRRTFSLFRSLQGFIFGDFSEQETEKFFGHDQQSVKVNEPEVTKEFVLSRVFIASRFDSFPGRRKNVSPLRLNLVSMFHPSSLRVPLIRAFLIRIIIRVTEVRRIKNRPAQR